MNRKAALIQTLVFVVFLGAFFALHLALPDRSSSGRESLQGAPRLTLSAVTSGRFMEQAEAYVSDQFPFREDWIAMKARAELLSGKAENNGVYLCENETLIEAYTAPDTASLEFSLDAVNALAEAADVPVYFALIPGANEVWRDKLPAGAPNASQKATIDHAYGYVAAESVDLYSALDAHKAEPIYYRTDHHWTALGAYYGYTALAEAMGFAPLPPETYRERVVTEEFYGTAWSTSGFSWVRPDRISAYVEQGDAVVTNYPQGVPLEGTLYDESYLDAIDKYSYFFGGNTPLLTIETGNVGPKLLILRDSYMDSLSPFLLAHFSEIHILDLRYYHTSLKAYLAEHAFDEILVCYSVKNFVEDSNIFMMAY